MIDNRVKYGDELGLKSRNGSLNLSVTGKSWRAPLSCRHQHVLFLYDEEFLFFLPSMYISIFFLFLSFVYFPYIIKFKKRTQNFLIVLLAQN